MRNNTFQARLNELTNRASRTPHEEAQYQALTDFNDAAGKVVQVTYVLAYYAQDKDGSDGRQDVALKTPALVRVKPDTHILDLIQYHDNNIDPEWDAELVQPHPELDPNTYDVKNLNIFGKSYNLTTGQPNPELNYQIVDPQPKPQRGELAPYILTLSIPVWFIGNDGKPTKSDTFNVTDNKVPTTVVRYMQAGNLLPLTTPFILDYNQSQMAGLVRIDPSTPEPC